VDCGCGYIRPLALLSVKDVPMLIRSIDIDVCILKCKGELDDFRRGLGEAGILEHMEKFPHLFRSMFVLSGDHELCAGSV
jgi:hypothetical protein